MPLWHHRVSFYEGGKLASTLDLCFVCGHVSWDATELALARQHLAVQR